MTRKPIQPPLLAVVTPLPFHRGQEVMDLRETLAVVGLNADAEQAGVLVDAGLRGLNLGPTPEHRQRIIDEALAAGWQPPPEGDNRERPGPRALP